MKPYRQRTVPYKLLAYMLYGRETWLSRPETGLVRVDTGKMARKLRVSNSRLWEAFEWLAEHKLVTEVVSSKRGTITARVKKPLTEDPSVE